jgi:hypothetical protein
MLASGLVACETIDVGPDTQPPSGCTARPEFFVSDVWPRFFEKYQCGTSNCHDASTGRGFFRLQSVTGLVAPAPSTPVASWPAAWQANLRAVELNLSCGNPASSPVLAIPAGKSQPHPGGTVVTDVADAEAIFRAWVQ